MKLITTFSIFAVTAATSSAAVLAPITDTSDTTDNPSFLLNHGYTPSSADLLHGLVPVTDGDFTRDGGTIAALNDGLFPSIDRGDFDFSKFAQAGFGTILGEEGGRLATFTFSTTVNINTIDVYSGWQDGGRDAQNFNIYVLTEGSSTFQLLNAAPIVYEPPAPPLLEGQGTPTASKVTVADSTGTLASNVTAIRFEFLGTEGAFQRYSGYAEIDVFGSAVPEPSSAALLGLGLLGALRRRR